MKKIRNVLIITLLFASIFGVIDFDNFVKADGGSVNLFPNGEFTTEADFLQCYRIGMTYVSKYQYACGSASGTHMIAFPGTGSTDYKAINGDLEQTLYFDAINGYKRIDIIYGKGDTYYTISITPDGLNDCGASSTISYVRLSLGEFNSISGKTLREIYETYSCSGAPPYSSVNGKVQVQLYLGSQYCLDNVYLWEGASKASVDGTLEAYCGDGTCDEDETCSTCSADCGSCYSGTVTHTLTPSVALAGETVSGTVILTDGISRQKPDSVIIKNTVGGVESTMLFTSEPVTDDENFTHYEFIPLDNLLQPGDVTMVATATYNGVEYQGVSTLTVSPPGEGEVPINPGDEGEVQDNIKWTFKFTKDVFDGSDYTPNYGVAGYYVVSAVPVVNNVDIPQYDAYVTVKVDSKIVLNNKYKHYLAFSGSSGSTEPFYFDMPTSAVNIDGECLINYNYYGTPRTITLKDTSKFSLSGNGGGNGGGDSDGKSIFTKVWEGVKGVAGDVWDGVYGKAKEVAGDAKEAVEDVAPDIYKALQTVTSDVWKAVSSTASKTFESVVKTVTGGSSGGSIFSGLGSFLSKAVYGIPVIFIVIGVVLIFVLRRD